MTLQPGLYEHYSGKQYEVIDVARHSETLEDCVVYRAQYGEHELWIRPLRMFCEEVEIDGKQLPRFRRIGSNTIEQTLADPSVSAQSTQNSEAYQHMDLQRGVDYIGVTVVFICHDGHGNVLLQKRSAACRDEQGRWDCGGGSMEFGESFEDAVRREVKEEYGVDPEEVQCGHVTSVVREHQGTKTHWIAVIHAVKVPREGVIIGEPKKMDAIGWFCPDQLPENLHSCFQPHFELVKPFIKNINSLREK